MRTAASSCLTTRRLAQPRQPPCPAPTIASAPWCSSWAPQLRMPPPPTRTPRQHHHFAMCMVLPSMRNAASSHSRNLWEIPFRPHSYPSCLPSLTWKWSLPRFAMIQSYLSSQITSCSCHSLQVFSKKCRALTVNQQRSACK